MRSKRREKRSKNVSHTRAKSFSKEALCCQSLLVDPTVTVLLHNARFPEHTNLLAIKQVANQAQSNENVLYKKPHSKHLKLPFHFSRQTMKILNEPVKTITLSRVARKLIHYSRNDAMALNSLPIIPYLSLFSTEQYNGG